MHDSTPINGGYPLSSNFLDRSDSGSDASSRSQSTSGGKKKGLWRRLLSSKSSKASQPDTYSNASSPRSSQVASHRSLPASPLSPPGFGSGGCAADLRSAAEVDAVLANAVMTAEVARKMDKHQAAKRQARRQLLELQTKRGHLDGCLELVQDQVSRAESDITEALKNKQMPKARTRAGDLKALEKARSALENDVAANRQLRGEVERQIKQLDDVTANNEIMKTLVTFEGLRAKAVGENEGLKEDLEDVRGFNSQELLGHSATERAREAQETEDILERFGQAIIAETEEVGRRITANPPPMADPPPRVQVPQQVLNREAAQ